MSVETFTATATAGASLESCNFRIHKWISTLPNDLSRDNHLSSLTQSEGRADSPLLGFCHQESVSNDPLHRPSPNYVRRLPDKPLPLPPSEARIPSPVSEDVEQDFNFPSPTPQNLKVTRHPGHLSFIQPRRSIPRQPSLPIFGTTSHLSQNFDKSMTPRARSLSTAASSFRPDFPPSSPIKTRFSTSPTSAPPPTPTLPTATLSSTLERQRLDALVIASGLAVEEEPQPEVPEYHPSSSQVYLGELAVDDLPTPRGRDTLNGGSTVCHSQAISSPCTSTLLEGVDEFDDDASYYGKEMDSLFSPCSRLSRCSRQADIDAPAASRWSLSSSIEIDLTKSRRNSLMKSPKNKREKFKSFISRFTPSIPVPSTDKLHPSIADDAGSDRRVTRHRSHSDLLASALGSWESVPPTPTTAVSSTGSTGYNESDIHTPPLLSRLSNEKLDLGPGLSRLDSPVKITRDSSSTSWSGTNTSVPNSPVDTIEAPQHPLKQKASTASVKANGLKMLAASIISLSAGDNSHEESLNETKKAVPHIPPPPANSTFKERMMKRNNGSALSLILGKSSNKNIKPKRKLLISGIERDNRLQYEAISNWCEGFGAVIVKQVGDGAIVADFHDASVAETVCRLQARVYINGAGSVNLAWTTKELYPQPGLFNLVQNAPPAQKYSIPLSYLS